MMSEENPKRPRWLAVLLVALPVWLMLSGAAGIWYFIHREKEAEISGRQRFARTVSVSSLADDMRKLTALIGERHTGSVEAGISLTRTAAMIEGLLGPSNTGYTVRRVRGPQEWPLLHVLLPGGEAKSAALWVVVSYDSRPGSPGVEANATGLAAVMAAAQAIADDRPARTVHFAFIPHANDPGAPVEKTAGMLRDLMRGTGPAGVVLCVEAMGGGSELWISARDAAAIPMKHTHALGRVMDHGEATSGSTADLAGMLADSGLPAVRVATRSSVMAGDPDARQPDSQMLASSAGRLIELIRRCAAEP
jgi:hypothetical protein